MKYLKISIAHFALAGIIIFFWLFSGCYYSFLYGPILEPKQNSRVVRLKEMSLIEQLEHGIDLHAYSARSKKYGGNDPEWDLEWIKIYEHLIEIVEKCEP